MNKTRNNKAQSLKQSGSFKRTYNKSIETLSDDELKGDDQYMFKTMKSLYSNKDIQSIEQIYIIINDLKQQNSILIDKCNSLEEELRSKQNEKSGPSSDQSILGQIAKALSLEKQSIGNGDILDEIERLKQDSVKHKQYEKFISKLSSMITKLSSACSFSSNLKSNNSLTLSNDPNIADVNIKNLWRTLKGIISAYASVTYELNEKKKENELLLESNRKNENEEIISLLYKKYKCNSKADLLKALQEESEAKAEADQSQDKEDNEHRLIHNNVTKEIEEEAKENESAN